MNLYGLIGYPLSHSFSKEYFINKFKKENIADIEFKLFEIDNLNNLRNIISENPDLSGLSVTIPYKQLIMNYLDDVDDTAREIGAVNCIRITRDGKKPILTGFNTDVFGFEKSLAPLLKPYHRKAVILGTGGASKAVAFVLDKLGIEYVFISRNPLMCNHIRYQMLNKDILVNHLLIINTSPVGMYPDIKSYPDIPYKNITKKHLLFDLIYNPDETLFLKKGKERGAAVKNGLEMLYLQAERSWEIWNKI